MNKISRIAMPLIVLVTVLAVLIGTPFHTTPPARAAIVAPHAVTTHVGMPCLQPSASLDYANLTDTQLKEYGLPPRNTDNWLAIAKKVKTNGCGREDTTHAATPSGQENFTVNQQTGTQGYAAYGSSYGSGDFTEAYGTWYHMCENATPTTGGQDAMWVGLGGEAENGDNSGILEQDGTAMQYFNNTWTNVMWYEDTANPPAHNVFTGVECNDVILCETYQYGSGTEFYMDDETQGYAEYDDVTTGPRLSSADYLLERDQSGDLESFDSFQLFAAGGWQYGHRGGTSWYYDEWQMHGYTGTGDPLASNSYWEHAPPEFSAYYNWVNWH